MAHRICSQGAEKRGAGSQLPRSFLPGQDPAHGMVQLTFKESLHTSLNPIYDLPHNHARTFSTRRVVLTHQVDRTNHRRLFWMVASVTVGQTISGKSLPP